jgi:hypothetical protein
MQDLHDMAEFYGANFNESYSGIFAAAAKVEGPLTLCETVVQEVAVHLITKYEARAPGSSMEGVFNCLEVFESLGSSLDDVEKWREMGRFTEVAITSYIDTCWCLEKYKLVEFISHFIPRLLVLFKIENSTAATDGTVDQ